MGYLPCLRERERGGQRMGQDAFSAARDQHRSGSLRQHRIRIVHQRRRRNDAAKINGSRKKQDR